MEEFARFETNTGQVKGGGYLEAEEIRSEGFCGETKFLFKLCAEYKVSTNFGLKCLYGLQHLQKLVFGGRSVSVKSKYLQEIEPSKFKVEVVYSLWVNNTDLEVVKKEIESACKSSISGQLSDNDQLDLFI